MPRRKSSIKRKRADKKRRIRNLRVKTDLKKTLKKFQAFLNAKNAAEAKNFLKTVYSRIDKAVKKGILHRNTANRKKSRLMHLLSKSA